MTTEETRIDLIAETVALLTEELADGGTRLTERGHGDLLWFRLGKLSQLWSGSPADLRDLNPQIVVVGLPTEQQTLSGRPRPATAEVRKMARDAVEAFEAIVSARQN